MDSTTGTLIVAALSVLTTPLTAWLSFRWGRGQERERRDSERATETERWDREEHKRRVLRGEEAASRLLEVVDNAATLFTGQKLTQSDTKDAYTEVLRLAELLTDDRVRDKMGEVARGMYFYHSAFDMNGNLAYGNVATAFSSAAHDVPSRVSPQTANPRDTPSGSAACPNREGRRNPVRPPWLRRYGRAGPARWSRRGLLRARGTGLRG